MTLALNLHHDETKIFASEEWFTISLKPVYLKADIFEGRFSIKAIKNIPTTSGSWKTSPQPKNMEQVFQEERSTLHDFLITRPSAFTPATKTTA